MPNLAMLASCPRLPFVLAAAAALSTGPAAASEGDLGPYFEQLSTRPPPALQRPSYAPRFYAAPQPAPQPPQRFVAGALDAPTLEHTVFNHINLYRLAKGMRPLSHHPGLAGSARAHSSAMATGARALSHDGMRDRLVPHIGAFGYRGGGEILAYNRGAGDPARTAMRSWINSDRHKDVIEEDYTSMGVGVAQRADGAYYFTVLFVR
jgi:uncharacterized protein YkwD